MNGGNWAHNTNTHDALCTSVGSTEFWMGLSGYFSVTDRGSLVYPYGLLNVSLPVNGNSEVLWTG